MMEKLVEALNTLGISLFYAFADKNERLPYIVYTDYSERYSKADNHIDNIIVNVQVDFYTKVPLDDNCRAIRNTLDAAEITFTYTMMYDDIEKVYHHIYDCEVDA